MPKRSELNIVMQILKVLYENKALRKPLLPTNLIFKANISSKFFRGKQLKRECDVVGRGQLGFAHGVPQSAP